MRFALIPLLVLAACGPQVPASNPGPGFSSYGQYQSERDAALRGQAPISTEVPTVGLEPVSGGAVVAVQTGATSGTAAPTLGGNSAGISDEQSFDAVTARQTIESDAARRQAQAAAYRQVQPGALPTRPTSSGPNIVAYALAATNYKGQPVYQRSFPRPEAAVRKCAGYPSADAAQIAFLKAGGPERDRKGLDPDGDGFACTWDPAPFRRATGG